MPKEHCLTLGRLKNYQSEMGRLTSPVDNLNSVKTLCTLDDAKPKGERIIYADNGAVNWPALEMQLVC